MNGIHTFGDTTARVELRPVDPRVDDRLVHGWMHEPHVRTFWDMAWPRAELREYLVDLTNDAHHDPWIAVVDGTPIAYVETYDASDDVLAAVFPTRPGDRGWHVLVGPPDELGTGRPRLVGRAVLRHLLSEPGADRVLCEPDVRNVRMINFCRRLGHIELAVVELEHKHAAILGCDRAAFAARFPEDGLA